MHRRRHFLTAIALSGLGLWMAIRPAIGAEEPPAEKKAEQEKVPENADPDRYGRAAVVLRVQLIRPLGGETGVAWYHMKVLDTLKNTVRQKFGPTQDVFTAGRIGPGIPRDPGPPAMKCTIYLEPIVQRIEGKDVTHWRLLDGNSTSGVSHVAK